MHITNFEKFIQQKSLQASVSESLCDTYYSRLHKYPPTYLPLDTPSTLMSSQIPPTCLPLDV
eukprot:Pgem_evm1s2255